MVYKPQSRAAAGRPGTPICAVASSFCAAAQEPAQGRVLKAYFAALEEQSHLRRDGRQQTSTYTASFRRVAQAVPGREIWLIVETAGLEGVTLELTLRCARTDKLLPEGAVMPFVLAGAETIQGLVTVGGWDGGGRYSHTEMYGNWAIAALRIGPAQCRDWAERLEACEDHLALCYLELRALTGVPVEYSNEDPARPGTTHDRSVFMNESGRHLQLLCCCRADIRADELRQVFPGAPAGKIQAVTDELNREYIVNGRRQKLFQVFQLDSCLRRAHFFAQAKVESKLGSREFVGAIKGESLDYSIVNLLRGRPYACFANPAFPELRAQAIALGRGPYSYIDPATRAEVRISEAQQADQKGIANIALMDKYRDARHRLGNVLPGDGWNFRGRGMLQLTGRANYQRIQSHLDAVFPGNDAQLMAVTDDLSERQALLSGLGFWTRSQLADLADRGRGDAHVDALTRVINSATDSYQQRRQAFHLTSQLFSIQDCTSL